MIEKLCFDIRLWGEQKGTYVRTFYNEKPTRIRTPL